MKPKTRIIITSSLTILGLGMIGTGTYMELALPTSTALSYNETKRNPDIPIEEDLVITLKELHLSLNAALSMDVQSYINEPVANPILQQLVLDTSKVDMTKVGSYTYTITYQKKVFKGTIIVEKNTQEQPQPETQTLEKLTLKQLSLKLHESLPTDLESYIVEPLTDQIRNQIKIDLSSVNVTKAGSYQYTITYNNTVYTGTITIVEDQPPASPEPEESKSTDSETDDSKKDEEDEKKEDLPPSE